MRRARIRRPGFWLALIAGTLGILHLAIVVGILHHLPPDRDLFSVARPPAGEPEASLWRRLLGEEEEDCGLHATTTTHNATGGILAPSGFREHVRRFVEAPSPEAFRASLWIGDEPSNGNERALLRHGGDPSYRPCRGPPAGGSDRAAQYSVVVASREASPRRLLLRLMALLAYPTVHDVTVVLPTAQHEQLFGDRDYGDRLLDWHRTGVVRLIPGGLWDSLELVRPKQEAVLFLDGDAPKDWNGTRFLAGFGVWQQHPSSLVHVWSSPGSPAKASLSSAACPSGLHGTFLHRNLLCFLGHPVLEPLREHLHHRGGGEDPWETVPGALALVWNRLGDGHIGAGRGGRRPDPAVVGYLGCGCKSLLAGAVQHHGS